MGETTKRYEGGRQVSESTRNNHPGGGATTFNKDVHSGSLGTTVKEVTSVVKDHPDGHTTTEKRK